MFKTTETSQSGSDMQKKIRLMKCANIKKQKQKTPVVRPSIHSMSLEARLPFGYLPFR